VGGKVEVDVGLWEARDLADEDIVRLIWMATVIKTLRWTTKAYETSPVLAAHRGSPGTQEGAAIHQDIWRRESRQHWACFW